MKIKVNKPTSTTPLKIAVVGGGVSGLMSGILALKENNQVTIFEKNKTIGGAFAESITLGYSNNYLLLGTSYDEVRKNLNSIIDFSFVFPKETSFIYEYRGEKTIHFYKDLKKLKNELDELYPFDVNINENLINGISEASKLDYSLRESKKFFVFNKGSVQMASFYNKYGKKSIEDYCKAIKNEDYKKALCNFINPTNSISLLMLIMGLYVSGKLTMVNNPETILERLKFEFVNNKGELRLNSEVKKVTNKANKAIVTYGNDDQEEEFDKVIYASDFYNLFDNLIPKKYLSSKNKVFFNNSLDSKTMSLFVCTFNINDYGNELIDFKNTSYFSCKVSKKFRVGCKNNDEFKVFIKDNRLTIVFNQNDDDFEFFKLIHKNPLTYKKEISRITNDIEELLIKELGIGKLTIEKVLTPVDFESNFNQYKGGVFGYALTPNTIGANMEAEIKGFDELCISSAGLYRPFWFYSSAIASLEAIEIIKNNVTNKRG